MTPQHPAALDSPSSAGAPPSGLRGARRAAIIALVASVSIAAIVGIVVLLSGAYGQTQGQVLLTTLLVAAASAIALCHLAVAGRPVRLVGFVGLAVTAVAVGIGLFGIWGSNFDGYDVFLWFGMASIAAASLAHANLLLLLAGRRHPAVRILLGVTLAAIAGVAVLLIANLATKGEFPGVELSNVYWRTVGVLAIVDAVGTIVLPIVALLLRGRDAQAQPADVSVADVSAPPFAAEGEPAASAAAETSGLVDATGASETAAAPLAPALDARLAALEAATGLDRDAVLAAALDALEARLGGGGRA
ncbi:hypothetical protein ET445_06950 [Agromyces protaetiae]|uniref:Uncharacterized protein n=1 Tax=Agromyces protaetiae TaxID=2509455 RepID=A0A4P6FDQ1_9MICO|nr:hypothetical protein [Agromyces protaetiae]QAY73123.1 hypothetical protein ET445_06950 [Agromyces protaetiae]